MRWLLVVGKRLLKDFPNKSVCVQTRKWINILCVSVLNRFSYHCYVCMESKNMPYKTAELFHHKHINSCVGIAPVRTRTHRTTKQVAIEKRCGKTLAEFLSKIESDGENVVMTDTDWDSFLDTVEKENKFSRLDSEAFLMEQISILGLPELGLSLMYYIEKKRVPALSLFTALISVCGEKYPEIVHTKYDELLKHYPVLDTNNYIKLIQGISKTNDWKKCFEILEKVRATQLYKSTFTPGIEMVIEAAVTHNDMTALESLLSFAKKDCQFVLLPKLFSSAIFEAWKNGGIDMVKFLKILSENKGYLGLEEAKYLAEEWNRKQRKNFKIHWGNIAVGRCNVCGKVLEGDSPTDSQIKMLQERLESYISSSKFIYMYSDPKELKFFIEWCEEHGPFDVVVDVANLFSYRGKGKVPYKMQAENIKNFLEPFEKVLFVTRSMSHAKALNSILDSRHLLFMPTWQSDDDVFLVLAALKSGVKGHFFSEDNLNDLKAYIGGDVKPLFEHWQRYRQLFWESMHKRGQAVAMPEQYDFCVQEHDNGWHIPYTPYNRREERIKMFDKRSEAHRSFAMPDTVLCLHKT